MHASDCVPSPEGVALQIAVPEPGRLGVDGTQGGSDLLVPKLHLLGLTLPLWRTCNQITSSVNPEGAISCLPFAAIMTDGAVG